MVFSLPRARIGIRISLTWALALLWAAYVAPEARAQSEFQVLIDTDASPVTGCAVTTPDGTFAGVEQILTASVNASASTVTAVEQQLCANPASDIFGPRQPVSAGGWPVGTGGIGGARVVEACLAPGALPAGITVRLGYLSTDTVVTQDTVLTTDSGGPILLDLGPVTPRAIPSLGGWGLGLLALLLAAITLRLLRRHPHLVSAWIVFIGASGLGAGIAWAAVNLDGLTDDWNGIPPLATDPREGNLPDMVAVFGQFMDNQLCFRVDAFFDNAPNQPPSFTPGPNQSVPVNAGPQSIPGWATNISPGPPNESGQTVSFTVGNDNNPLFSSQPDVAPNGTLSFTPATGATGSATVSVQAVDNGGTANGGNDTSPVETFIVSVGLSNNPPMAANDSYDAVGNTLLEVVTSIPTGNLSVQVIGSVLDNDTDADGDGLTVIGTSGVAAGAVLNMNPDGTFSYTPTPGATGSETFQYMVDDGSGAPNSTDTGLVTIPLFDLIWYVDNTATAGGNGTSSAPFNALKAAESPTSGTGDTVFVFAGDGTTSNQDQGFLPVTDQRLLGQGVDLVADLNGTPVTLVTAANRPRITNAGGDGIAIAGVGGVQIMGLDIAGSDNAIDVSGAGVTISNNTISGAGSEGIRLLNTGAATSSASISNNAITATGNAIHAATTAGALNIAISANLVTSTTGNGIALDGTGGGELTVTGFAGNQISGDVPGIGVSAVAVTFDATPGLPLQTVAAGNAVIGASGNGVGSTGITLQSVTGDLSFADLDVFSDANGGIDISGTGAFAPGTGGLRVSTGAGSSATAIGGTALAFSSASANLGFSALTSTNSPAEGINLDGVGGTLNVSGTATISNSSGNGVQIQNSAATVTFGSVDVFNANPLPPDLGLGRIEGGGIVLRDNSGTFTVNGGSVRYDITNNAIGVFAHNTGPVTLQGSTGALCANCFQISGTGVGSPTGTGFVIRAALIEQATDVVFDLVEITNTGRNDEGIDLRDIAQSASVTNSAFSNFNLADALLVSTDNATQTLDLTISGNSFTGDLTTQDIRDAIVVNFDSTSGHALTATIDNNTFDQVKDAVILRTGDGSVAGSNPGAGAAGRNMITVDNNTIRDVHEDGIEVRTEGAAVTRYNLTNNSLNGVVNVLPGDRFSPPSFNPDRGIDLFFSTGPFTGTVDVLVDNNQIDNFEDELVRSRGNQPASPGTIRAQISNNILQFTGGYAGFFPEGVRFAYLEVHVVDVTIMNNLIDVGALESVEIIANAPGAPSICVDATGNNNGAGTPPSGPFLYRALAGVLAFPMADATAVGAANNGATVMLSGNLPNFSFNTACDPIL